MYTITVYSPKKKVIVLRAVVITGFIFLMLSLVSMIRMHGVHGGAHHMLGAPSDANLPGGHTPLDPCRDMHHRISPVYNPETERSYTWRDYVRDIGIWCMMTDLQPHQQCAALISRLQGHAREIAQLIPARDIALGVFLEDGTYVDPVSNLMAQLSSRFAPYEDEERNEAMMQVWTFRRKHNESIDSLLSRFEELRYRAAREGHYIMSIEGWSMRLLQNCPLSQAQNLHVLEPFAYQMPHTEEQ